MPIFKKDSPHCVFNYRPTSLVSILNKILEKVYHCLSNYLEKHSVIYEKQFGFRAQHSTTLLSYSYQKKIKSLLIKDFIPVESWTYKKPLTL